MTYSGLCLDRAGLLMAQEDSTEAEMASEGSEDTVRSSPARRALKIGGGVILGLIQLVLLAVAAPHPGERQIVVSGNGGVRRVSRGVGGRLNKRNMIVIGEITSI